VPAFYAKISQQLCVAVTVALCGGPAYAAEVYFDGRFLDITAGVKDVEAAMFDAVNDERDNEGVGQLKWDERLAAAARQHSDEMVRLLYFAHESPTPGLKDATDRVYSAGLTDAEVGENLASENNIPDSSTADEVGRELTAVLMASEKHRDNILDRRYTHIGVGCIRSGDGTLFCTQVFSKRFLAVKSIKLSDKTIKTSEVALALKTDQEVGVWVDDDIFVFKPEDGVVNVSLRFSVDRGVRKVVMARRPVGTFGRMEAFFVGKFDPGRPQPFALNVDDPEVISENQTTNDVVYYVLEAEGKVLAGDRDLKIADGDVRYPVKLKGAKFKIALPLPANSGRHTLYVVAGDEAGHRLVVDTDALLDRAFGQVEAPRGPDGR